MWRCLHHRLSLCGVCVWGGGGGGQNWGAKQRTDQVTILATYQCTNTPTTRPHSRRGVGACWMYLKRKFAICWNQHVPAVVQTIGLNATGTSPEQLTRTQPEQRLPKV